MRIIHTHIFLFHIGNNRTAAAAQMPEICSNYDSLFSVNL